ncbi:hypothetical protein OH76DRAFT_852364 [Lentinus brumalis]|uniref:Uncharacterized protein n=1 Tax=Lentinus brumalis TaxID=2498619 RepID=A0A371DR20_9APHY|nr:hypothetical protein OH76DRAFT_852364 [Polyporus brumalis]
MSWLRTRVLLHPDCDGIWPWIPDRRDYPGSTSSSPHRKHAEARRAVSNVSACTLAVFLTALSLVLSKLLSVAKGYREDRTASGHGRTRSRSAPRAWRACGPAVLIVYHDGLSCSRDLPWFTSASVSPRHTTCRRGQVRSIIRDQPASGTQL